VHARQGALGTADFAAEPAHAVDAETPADGLQFKKAVHDRLISGLSAHPITTPRANLRARSGRRRLPAEMQGGKDFPQPVAHLDPAHNLVDQAVFEEELGRLESRR